MTHYTYPHSKRKRKRKKQQYGSKASQSIEIDTAKNGKVAFKKSLFFVQRNLFVQFRKVDTHVRFVIHTLAINNQ